MHVLMIEPLGDGGIAHYTLNLLEALARRGFMASLLTATTYEFAYRTSSFRALPVMFKIAGGVVRRMPWLARETPVPSVLRRVLKLLEYPLNIAQALRLVGKERITLVHFQSVNLVEIVMVLSFKVIGRRVVFTVHNVLPRHERMRFYHPFLYRILYRLCDHLIIHSESGRDDVIRLFGVEAEKMTVIPHGDYKFFLPERELRKDDAKAALGIRASSKTMLFFGAIRPNKGLDNLLKALSLVRKRIPDVTLLIAGEPCESYGRYAQIIEAEKLQESIHQKLSYITHDEVSIFFSASDLVVLPYNEITQSGVLQIAMAFGKPVVATAIGGFKEAIEHGKNGYLVQPGDIEALAERIGDILSDEATIDRMGRHSRYLSDAHYSWESIAERTLSVYAKVNGHRAA